MKEILNSWYEWLDKSRWNFLGVIWGLCFLVLIISNEYVKLVCLSVQVATIIFYMVYAYRARSEEYARREAFINEMMQKINQEHEGSPNDSK